MHPSRHRLILLAATTAATVVAGTLGTVAASAAAVGCRVDYQITNQWQGGFGANVTVTNLGDPVNGWTLTWSYTAGQQVTQAWNATVTQSGAQVTARNVGYNAALATNGTATFGFNGSWTGSNPVPASFALNGTTCTGAADHRRTDHPAADHATPTTPPPTTPPPPPPRPPRRRPAGRGEADGEPRPGLISVRSGSGNLVSWRLLGTETSGVAFNLYRGAHQGQRQPDHRRHQLPRQRRGGRLGVHRAGRGRRRRAGGVRAGAAVRRGLPGRAVAGPGRRHHPERRGYTYSRQRRLRRRPRRRRQLRDRAQVGPVQRQGQLPVRLHRQRLRRRVHASTAPGCGASTWAATSAPAPTTPSSRCTTTTATAAPRWP